MRIAASVLTAGALLLGTSACGGSGGEDRSAVEAEAATSTPAPSAVATESTGPVTTSPTADVTQPPKGETDKAAISRVATEWVLADPSRKCALYQQLYISVYANFSGTDSRQICVAGYRRFQSVDRPTGARVDSITVQGGVQARARITVVGGPFDGVTGRWSFSKIVPGTEDGGLGGEMSRSGVWLLGEQDVAWMRSRSGKELGAAYPSRGPGDPLDDATNRSCARTELNKLEEPYFAAAYYSQFSGGVTLRSAVVLGCVKRLHAADLRDAYRFELVDALRLDGKPENQTTCAVDAYLGRLTDAKLAKAAVRGREIVEDAYETVPDLLEADLKKCGT